MDTEELDTFFTKVHEPVKNNQKEKTYRVEKSRYRH